MRTKLLYDNEGLRTFVVVMDKGDEAVEQLTDFALEHRVTAAGFTGVGAASTVALGYFDAEISGYLSTDYGEQLEVLSLIGDIAVKDDKPAVHAHVTLGRKNNSVIGGHLKSLIVWPTLEVLVNETPAHLAKKIDPETGLALIDLRA